MDRSAPRGRKRVSVRGPIARCLVATKEPAKAETVLKRLVATYPPQNDTVKEATAFARDAGLTLEAPPAGVSAKRFCPRFRG